MTGLLTDVAKRLTEAWLTRLALPGVLYVATIVVASILGWAHAVDLRVLTTTVDDWINDSLRASMAGVVVVAALAVLLSAGIGLAAEGIGSLLAAWWPGEYWRSWPRPFRAVAAWRIDRRVRRWDTANAAYHGALAELGRQVSLAEVGLVAARPYDLAHLYYPVARLGRERPTRPTWVGDRLHLLAATLHQRYGLDLSSVWPALSLQLPPASAEAVEAARQDYQRAATLAAWGLLYLPVGVLWGPALLVSLATTATARYRARAAVERYCLLIEAAAVLHTPQLMQALGIDAPSGLNKAVGTALTQRLRDGTTDA